MRESDEQQAEFDAQLDEFSRWLHNEASILKNTYLLVNTDSTKQPNFRLIVLDTDKGTDERPSK